MFLVCVMLRSSLHSSRVSFRNPHNLALFFPTILLPSFTRRIWWKMYQNKWHQFWSPKNWVFLHFFEFVLRGVPRSPRTPPGQPQSTPKAIHGSHCWSTWAPKWRPERPKDDPKTALDPSFWQSWAAVVIKNTLREFFSCFVSYFEAKGDPWHPLKLNIGQTCAGFALGTFFRYIFQHLFQTSF